MQSPASRGKLFEELADQVTRSALESAQLTPEDRVLTRQRVQKEIAAAAGQAQGDVIALAHGDSHGPEAERFSGYLNSTYRQQRDDDLARPDAEMPPARRLAAELVASDSRTNTFHPMLTRRAEYYIAHVVTAAAQEEVRKTLDNSSRTSAPAVATESAARVVPEAAQGPAATSGPRSPAAKPGPSIG